MRTILKYLFRFFQVPALVFIVGVLAPGSTLHAQPVTCTTPPPDHPCLYVPVSNYNVGAIEFAIQDPLRPRFLIPLLVRFPVGSQAVHPVVIWHHGGEPAVDANRRSSGWGDTLAAAGYVVIHPSRIPVRDPRVFQRECVANGFRLKLECERWVAQSRLGPQTTQLVIENLALIEATIGVSLHPGKIAVAGHSAGTIAVLSNAGAWQQWVPGGEIYTERDDRPVAFLATAPQGPMYANYLLPGFQSGDSFEFIDRPLALITGVGDRTGEPHEARTTSWLKSMPGNKFLSYDTDSEALHETMNINVCDGPVRTQHCGWIASFGLAFLDAAVNQRQEAIDWLESDAYRVLTGGAIELHRR